MFRIMKKQILAVLAVFVFMYLLWAFVAVEIDFREWHMFGRGSYAICSVFGSIVAAMATDLNEL